VLFISKDGTARRPARQAQRRPAFDIVKVFTCEMALRRRCFSC
jgi:hypothetical protein